MPTPLDLNTILMGILPNHSRHVSRLSDNVQPEEPPPGGSSIRFETPTVRLFPPQVTGQGSPASSVGHAFSDMVSGGGGLNAEVLELQRQVARLQDDIARLQDDRVLHGTDPFVPYYDEVRRAPAATRTNEFNKKDPNPQPPGKTIWERLTEVTDGEP